MWVWQNSGKFQFSTNNASTAFTQTQKSHQTDFQSSPWNQTQNKKQPIFILQSYTFFLKFDFCAMKSVVSNLWILGMHAFLEANDTIWTHLCPKQKSHTLANWSLQLTEVTDHTVTEMEFGMSPVYTDIITQG